MNLAAALLTFTLAATDAHQSARTSVEANPVMRPLVQHPAALYGVKIGSATLTTWTVQSLHKDGRHKTAWIVWASINAAQGFVVWHNAGVK